VQHGSSRGVVFLGEPERRAETMATILLVEDDANECLLYENELRAAGHTVVTAHDGQQALNACENAAPDLVVMDISMPAMDGIEAMSRMLSKDHKLPVILNSAYATYKDNFRAWSADAYVVKSSDMVELKETIKRVLAESAAQSGE